MKIKNRLVLILSAGFLFIIFLSFEGQAQDGKALFRQTCGACHTIGKGRIVGPDLAGITSKFSEEWLFEWTRSSQSMVKKGDKDAVAIFEEYNGLLMPDQNLTDAELKAIYAYIESESPEDLAEISSEPVHNASDDAGPEEIERGKNLFAGSLPLSNGGPACIACHNVDYKGVIPGGLLAKDLTTGYSRMGMDAGIRGILGAPPFPAMTESYKNHPITDNEISDLTAFLNKVDKDSVNQKSSAGQPLLYGGLPGLLLLLTIYSVVWYGRKRTTVKKDIYQRQIKSI